jgi:hypothetical protein
MAIQQEARREAIAAVEEFKRTRGHGLSDGDLGVLQRLGSNDYADQASVAWDQIGRNRKRSDDDQYVIIYLLEAWHFGLEAGVILKSYESRVEYFRRLRRCAEELRGFFTADERARFSGEGTSGEVNQVLQSLSWTIDIFDRCEHEISTLAERLGLTREVHSSTGHRVTFMVKMCEGMVSLFGSPLYEAVAALTDIVFKREPGATTIDQVRSAWKLHGMQPKR